MAEHHMHGEHSEHEHEHEHDNGGGQSTMGFHGMLLFGEEALYLSHLPMFERPHNFQVLLEVGFDDAVLDALRADREAGGELHTFDPEKFPISELDDRSGAPARTTIVGTVFHGHFERGGTPITGQVTAQVRNVVYFRELDIKATHDPGRDLDYLCFGRAGQLHLAHQITARPDFDQVLTTRLVPGTVTDPAGRPVDAEVTGDFNRAQPVVFRERHDTPKDRLAPNETADGFFFATPGPTGSHGFGTQLEIGKELYVEMGELGSH
jgi:hypothetical protein